MGASERRRAILEVLCQRRQDTRENLAHEFGVSLRTISNDIDELSRTYPIITTRGKYGGGIKVLDGYRLDRKYLNPAQQNLNQAGKREWDARRQPRWPLITTETAEYGIERMKSAESTLWRGAAQ